MKRSLVIICLTVSIATFTGCYPANVSVAVQPVAPVFSRPMMPGTGYIWIDGEWRWRHGRYVYKPGFWARARPHHTWHPGVWVQVGSGFHWQRGRWR